VASPVPTFCDKAEFIALGKNDKLSLETANVIIKHNQNGIKLCGWKAPK